MTLGNYYVVNFIYHLRNKMINYCLVYCVENEVVYLSREELQVLVVFSVPELLFLISHTHTHINLYQNGFIYVCVSTHTYICVCVYIYIYIYI